MSNYDPYFVDKINKIRFEKTLIYYMERCLRYIKYTCTSEVEHEENLKKFLQRLNDRNRSFISNIFKYLDKRPVETARIHTVCSIWVNGKYYNHLSRWKMIKIRKMHMIYKKTFKLDKYNNSY